MAVPSWPERTRRNHNAPIQGECCGLGKYWRIPYISLTTGTATRIGVPAAFTDPYWSLVCAARYKYTCARQSLCDPVNGYDFPFHHVHPVNPVQQKLGQWPGFESASNNGPLA